MSEKHQDVEKRITELEKEVVSHRQRISECQIELQKLANLIVSKEGGIIELKRLLEEEEDGDSKNPKRSDGKN